MTKSSPWEPPAVTKLRNACRAADKRTLESARDRLRTDQAHFAPAALYLTETEIRRRQGFVEPSRDQDALPKRPVNDVDAPSRTVIVGIGLIGVAVVATAFLRLVAWRNSPLTPPPSPAAVALETPDASSPVDLGGKSAAALWALIETGSDDDCAQAVIELGRRGRADDLEALSTHRRAAARAAVPAAVLASGRQGKALIPLVAEGLSSQDEVVRRRSAACLSELVARFGAYQTR